MLSENFTFIIKTSTLYGVLAAFFSIIGLFLPWANFIGNPLEVSGISVEHVAGHIVWGLMIGLVTFRFKYFLMAGVFTIILDFDHLILFLGMDVVPRMAHSILFALIAIFVMMMIFGKRDYLLGAISFAAVLSHISFDILLDGGSVFPLFTPFTDEMTVFQEFDWILIQLGAVIIVGISVYISRREKKKEEFRI